MEVIDKPATLEGHRLHRAIAGVTANAWADIGDKVLIGAAKHHDVGAVVAGTLKACVGKKVRGRHRYFPLADWRSRHEWFERKGAVHGFEVLACYCTAGVQRIEKPGSSFSIDATEFTFVLKVTDSDKFSAALEKGVSSTCRTYGFGLLCI